MGEFLGDVKWSVDSIVLRDGCLFTYGWCAAPSRTILQLNISLEYASGTSEEVPTQYGSNRADVKAAHPNLPVACGYFAYAPLTHAEPLRSVWLSVHWSDGDWQRVSCPVPEQLPSGKAEWFAQTLLQWRVLLSYFYRGLRLLMRGQWHTAWQRSTGLRQMFRRSAGDDNNLRAVFSELQSGAALVVDHSLGGGANNFRATLIQQMLESGRDVILWVYTPYLLRHEISIHADQGRRVRRFHMAWEKWALLLESRKISEVVFNNCVGFSRQELVPAMLTAFRQVGGAHLQVYLHDFHMVCPSHFLLDYKGEFCGVPDVEQCRRCLPHIDNGLARLFVARDIDLWRERWGEMLKIADNIVYFSESSRALLSRAYPMLRNEQWVFRPHQLPPTLGQFRYPFDAPGLRVAVVGHIGHHKGRDKVLDLVCQARQQQVALQLVVLGTLETGEASAAVLQLGAYQREDLCRLLNENQVHMALMPSICPETFSYVTHELMQLGVPLVCFNIGAQAEAVAAYERGCVVPLGNGQALLSHIKNFKAKLDSLWKP